MTKHLLYNVSVELIMIMENKTAFMNMNYICVFGTDWRNQKPTLGDLGPLLHISLSSAESGNL